MKKQHAPAKRPYREGTWFAVPLRQGGYVVGRVARHTVGGKIVLAYFFGPKHDGVPTLPEIETSEPATAIKIMMAGDLGFLDGSWPIIGDSLHWNRQDWPIPPFIRRDDLSRSAWRVIYSDDDTNKVVSEERIPYETQGLQDDVLSGHKAAEIHLSRLFEA
jgi:hypothetical protein